MTKTFAYGAIAGLASLIAGPALATTLNISFTGQVDSTNDGANNPVASVGTLAVGDDVSGSFSLDKSALLSSTTATRGTYGGAVTGFTMTLDGLSFFAAGPSDFEVRDDDMAGSSAPLRDSVLVAGYSPLGPSVNGQSPARIQFALGGTDTSILSDLSIPDAATLEDLFAADTIGGNLNFLSLADGSDVRFRVSSLTITTPAVPLPAAAPMLAAGIGGLVALRRRRKAS